MPTDVLKIWTVFFSPKDCPGKYVVRLFHVESGNPEPIATKTAYMADTLDAIRMAIPAGLYCQERSEGDDVSVVESWF